MIFFFQLVGNLREKQYHLTSLWSTIPQKSIATAIRRSPISHKRRNRKWFCFLLVLDVFISCKMLSEAGKRRVVQAHHLEVHAPKAHWTVIKSHLACWPGQPLLWGVFLKNSFNWESSQSNCLFYFPLLQKISINTAGFKHFPCGGNLYVFLFPGWSAV